MTPAFAPPHANLLSLKLLFSFTDSCPTAPPHPIHPPHLPSPDHLRPTPQHQNTDTRKHNHAWPKVLQEKVKKSQRKISFFCVFFIQYSLLVASNHFWSLYDRIHIVSITIPTGSYLSFFFQIQFFFQQYKNHMLIKQILNFEFNLILSVF